MSELLPIEVAATHLYPGASAVLRGDHPAAGERDCIVTFSDMVWTTGRIAFVSGEAARLEVQAYRTAAGTDVASKAWDVAVARTSDGIALRVRRRLGAPAPRPSATGR